MVRKAVKVGLFFSVAYMILLGSAYLITADSPARLEENPVLFIIGTLSGAIVIGTFGINVLIDHTSLSTLSAWLIGHIALVMLFGLTIVTIQDGYHLMDGSIYIGVGLLLLAGFSVGAWIGSKTKN